MPRNQKLSVGKFYVNRARTIAREIVAGHATTIIFITYHLDTGNSCHSPSECMKRDFINWADHEAGPVELAIIQRHRMDDIHHTPQFLTPQMDSVQGD